MAPQAVVPDLAQQLFWISGMVFDLQWLSDDSGNLVKKQRVLFVALRSSWVDICPKFLVPFDVPVLSTCEFPPPDTLAYLDLTLLA